MDDDLVGNLQLGVGEVPYRGDAGSDQDFRGCLGEGGRHGEDRYLGPDCLDALLEVLHRADGNAMNLRPHLLRISIEGCHYSEAVTLEFLITHQG